MACMYMAGVLWVLFASMVAADGIVYFMVFIIYLFKKAKLQDEAKKNGTGLQNEDGMV